MIHTFPSPPPLGCSLEILLALLESSGLQCHCHTEKAAPSSCSQLLPQSVEDARGATAAPRPPLFMYTPAGFIPLSVRLNKSKSAKPSHHRSKQHGNAIKGEKRTAEAALSTPVEEGTAPQKRQAMGAEPRGKAAVKGPLPSSSPGTASATATTNAPSTKASGERAVALLYGPLLAVTCHFPMAFQCLCQALRLWPLRHCHSRERFTRRRALRLAPLGIYSLMCTQPRGPSTWCSASQSL